MKRVLIVFVLILMTLSIQAQENCDRFTEATYHLFGQYKDYEHGTWELIFEDDFNDSIIDKEKWFTCIDGWNREHGNTELQYYLDDNIMIDNGILKLTTKEEPSYYDVWRFNDDGSGYVVSKFFKYTSGWIQTKMNFKYGLFEVRCKIPEGQGFWPAFWLYGNGEEIDIFEFASNEQSNYLTTVHKWHDNGNHDYCPKNRESNTSFANDFHKFSLEWDEFVLIFRVDGVVKRIVYNYYNMLGQSIGNYQSATNGIHTRFALFPNNPQSMILNLAVPGEESNFGEPPTSRTVFPSSLDIDYIKVYKRKNPNKNISICDYNSSEVNIYTGQTINVAGDCNVVVEDDECLNMVACNEIIISNGFEALEGSSVSANVSLSTRGNDIIPIIEDNNLETYQFDTLYNRQILKDTDLTIDIEYLFDLYPDPNDGNFKIELSKHPITYKQIQIFDMYGNLIYNIDTPKNYSYTFNLPRKQGLYMVRCVFSDKIKIKKFVIN